MVNGTCYASGSCGARPSRQYVDELRPFMKSSGGKLFLPQDRHKTRIAFAHTMLDLPGARSLKLDCDWGR